METLIEEDIKKDNGKFSKYGGEATVTITKVKSGKTVPKVTTPGMLPWLHLLIILTSFQAELSSCIFHLTQFQKIKIFIFMANENPPNWIYLIGWAATTQFELMLV